MARAFMKRAVALGEATSVAGHGMAYGVVVVKGDKIIGEDANRIYVDHDPAAHGEIQATQNTCRRPGTNHLAGTVIYTSGGAPCPMCATACYWATIPVDAVSRLKERESLRFF
jgi:guanine deaminase